MTYQLQEGEWQNDMCHCTPCGSCFLGCCMPCVLYGKTTERINNPTAGGVAGCNRSCGIFCLLQGIGCGWIPSMFKRQEIRERYGIKGSAMSDCCISYWCMCCALVQQDKEVMARVVSSPITQGYQPQMESMTI